MFSCQQSWALMLMMNGQSDLTPPVSSKFYSTTGGSQYRTLGGVYYITVSANNARKSLAKR
jgi:hypothetical protein